ncbi:glycosyltransferase family 4 protein [Panaeolus papilionaceus]|nr:glycosyltransferase family 4 protein [Panaeolus papilionaceus]
MISSILLVVGGIYTVVSLSLILLLFALEAGSWVLRSTNHERRKAIFAELGIDGGKKRLVAYFHPYCNAGGGGERVLWTAIASVQRNDPDVISVVYSGDSDVTKEEIVSKVKSRFDIALDPRSLHFVFLESRYLVEDSAWPRFTLLGQSLGSMVLAFEAARKILPDLYIDTMGYAFSFHVFSLLGKVPIGAYVHYPTISTDMLARVKSRKTWHTNTNAISSSAFLSSLKLLYYRLFMYHYAQSLRKASFLMVNSTWTRNHIQSILRHSDPLLEILHLAAFPLFALLSRPVTEATPQIVYPPCDTKEISQFSLTPRERVVLSVAQFRPEKDHLAQVQAFHQLLEIHPEHRTNNVQLVMIGGSRNDGDARRVEGLRKAVKDLDLEAHAQIIVNAPYATVLNWLSRASIGLSTMVDEHFGINIIEFMAAGVIPVAHASGGPLKDIIVPYQGERTGFHATNTLEFAQAMHTVLTLSPEDERNIRFRTRAWAVERFSEKEFEKGWNASGWRDFL